MSSSSSVSTATVISFAPIAEEAEEKNVDLSHKGVAAPELAKLAVSLMGRSVTGLVLDHNSLGDAGCAVLANILLGSRSIATLSARDNSIHPPGVASLTGAIQASRSLKTLRLSLNYLGPEGARTIGHAVSSSLITELDLRENYLTENGASALAAAMAGKCLSLLRLDLSLNFLTSEGAVEILGALPASLTHLDLSENLIDRDAVPAIKAAVLSKSPRLRTLKLERNKFTSEDMVAILTAGVQLSSGIEELGMAFCAADEMAMKTIALGLPAGRRVRVKALNFIFRPPKERKEKEIALP